MKQWVLLLATYVIHKIVLREGIPKCKGDLMEQWVDQRMPQVNCIFQTANSNNRKCRSLCTINMSVCHCSFLDLKCNQFIECNTGSPTGTGGWTKNPLNPFELCSAIWTLVSLSQIMADLYNDNIHSKWFEDAGNLSKMTRKGSRSQNDG